jgi:hypothetical protein
MRPEYPRSLHEFRKLFADEAACRLYLARSRWAEGVRCPRCGHHEALELRTRLLWRCRACGHDTPVTMGTVLHRTRVPGGVGGPDGLAEEAGTGHGMAGLGYRSFREFC